MTIDVSNNNPRIEYAVTTAQSAFTIPFEFFDDGDILAYVGSTLKTITTHYTISGGGGSTGTLTFSPSISNATVVITRNIPLERVTDFTAGADINRAALNEQLDTLVAQIADVDDKASRTIQIPDYEVSTGVTLPAKDDRKGRLFAFNESTGAPEVGPTIANAQTLAAISSDIATLADIEDGTVATNAIQDVAAIASNVTTVAGISGNVTTVAGNNANVTTVAGISGNVTAVANDLSNVDIAAANIASINTNATSIGSINTVAADQADIGVVATDIANINTVAGISANVNTVAGMDAADIGLVAGVSTHVPVVSGISGNVTTVAGIAANVTAVANNETNINITANNIGDVNSFANKYRISSSAPTTSLDSGDLWWNTVSNELRAYDSSLSLWAATAPTAENQIAINIVAGDLVYSEDLGSIATAVTTGTGNSITTVGDDIASVITVAGSIANVNTAAGAITNVNLVGNSVANVNTVAASIADINRYAAEYLISATAPSSPDAGDLWYDSTLNTLKYYTGSIFAAISAGISSVSSDPAPVLGGVLDAANNNLTNVGTISGSNLQLDFGGL